MDLQVSIATALLFLFAISVNAEISFNPSQFNSGDDGWFEVRWNGIPAPGEGDTNDLVALFATSENPVQIGKQVPISYIYPFLIDQNGWKQGKGSYKFYIMNYFSDIQAVYVRGGNVVPPNGPQGSSAGSAPGSSAPNTMGSVVDQGTLTVNSNKTGPVRKVLAYANDPSAVRVTWSAPHATSPVVYYGTSPKSLNNSVAAEASTFSASDMCTPPATTVGYLSPGTQLSAEMTGLEPNTRYYYRVGDKTDGFSEVESFVSPPKIGDDSVLKLFVIADHGAYNLDNSSYFTGAVVAYSYRRCIHPFIEHKHMPGIIHVYMHIQRAKGYTLTHGFVLLCRGIRSAIVLLPSFTQAWI